MLGGDAPELRSEQADRGRREGGKAREREERGPGEGAPPRRSDSSRASSSEKPSTIEPTRLPSKNTSARET